MTDAGRWHQYVLTTEDVLQDFWEARLREPGDTLVVLGVGFDPRMLVGARTLLDAGGPGRRDVIALSHDEGPTSPTREHEPLVNANRDELRRLFQARGAVHEATLAMWSPDGKRRVGSENAYNLFPQALPDGPYRDLVVDISAMPRGIYMPLLIKLLRIADSGGTVQNLHVLVAENFTLDRQIAGEGVEVSYLHPFSGPMNMEYLSALPKVWIPILGEGRATHLRELHYWARPDEVLPVLPSPSRSPRRADDLVLEYHDLLDEWNVTAKNYLHVAEDNPFEAYRQLRRAVLSYHRALAPISSDACKVSVSPLSSKLVSLGALLSVYELRWTEKEKLNVGIANAEPRGYSFQPDRNQSERNGSARAGGVVPSQLFHLWIAGEAYAL